MILTVKDVDYLGDYTLLCTFNDGVTKKVDLQPLLKYPAFAELKDKKKFVQFGLDQLSSGIMELILHRNISMIMVLWLKDFLG